LSVPVFSLAHIDGTLDVLATLRGVVARHHYILGPAVAAFERSFARYCGVEHCIGVANGTDALEIALRALDVGAGDRVALVANAGHYGSTAVRTIGAMPVYVDVSPATRTMSPVDLRRALTQDVAAVIVTHLFGRLAEMGPIMAAARDAGVPVVEDCAQAHGATSDGVLAGAFGDIGCFSFYPTKNLGAIGDAGALVTADAGLAERIRRLRQYGWAGKYHVALQGGRNSRLDEIQAAVLDAKLPHLDGWNAERRELALRYVDGLADLPIGLPGPIDEGHVAHLFVIETSDRAGLVDHLRLQGVETAIHYPVPDHRQAAYFPAGPPLRLPVTDALADGVLTLPCYPGLGHGDQDVVIGSIRAYVEGQGA
jgi:dTDP-3-amino-2,3,6-trideoxy-4-keto-D-glucose/dTDP-3-amino-3,4,6-trideoxy-alpha-D-glucose/dTDP-2,6-dideoxy-D-kanosamine transaminase